MSNCVWSHADAVLPALIGSASQLFSKAKTKTDCASSGKLSRSCCCCWCCDKFVLAAEGAALSTARLLFLDLTMYSGSLTFIYRLFFWVFSCQLLLFSKPRQKLKSTNIHLRNGTQLLACVRYIALESIYVYTHISSLISLLLCVSFNPNWTYCHVAFCFPVGFKMGGAPHG